MEPQRSESSLGGRPSHRGVIVLVLAVVLVPFVLLFATVGAVAVLMPKGCGCLATPDPNWTPTPPPPYTATQVEAVAAGFARESMWMAPGDWYSIDGQPVAHLTSGGDGVVAFVNGNTGMLVAIVFETQLPDSETAAVSAEAATGAAEAFIERASVSTEGQTAAVQLERVGGVAYFDVRWKTADGREMEQVLVDASSGQVFGYRNAAEAGAPALPVLNWTRALALASGSAAADGEAAADASQQFPDLELTSVQPEVWAWQWTVSFQSGLLSVNATTGEVSRLKWAK